MRCVAISLALFASVTPVLAQQPSSVEQAQALQVELQQARRDGSELSLALARTQAALTSAQAENDKLKAAQATPAPKPGAGAPAKP